jgi:hypothetical protein
MESRGSDSYTDPNNIELAKRCLALISDIAGRGACSQNPEHIGHALQELSQVMLERTGSNHRRFEPAPADQIRDLEWLHEQLDQVNSYSEDMAASLHGYGFLGLWMHRLGFRFCRCQEGGTFKLSGGTWN